MHKRIIFHIPFYILKNRYSGSTIRPGKLINAFKEAGYIVEIISGYGKDRKKRIKELTKSIEQGVKYDFLYSESSALPTLLTEKNHLPLFPNLDFRFLKYVKSRHIPVGLFYRDIYWKFKSYDGNPYYRVIIYPFHLYDLYQYERFIDVLFLPSIEMKKYLTKNLQKLRIVALPPGLSEDFGINNITTRGTAHGESLSLIYVGGLSKLRKVDILLKVLQNRKSIILNLCTRYDDWTRIKQKYEHMLGKNVHIKHLSPKKLAGEYNSADIASFYLEPIEYHEFSMPLKLFEYIKFNKPILASKGTLVGKFVDKYDIGWTLEYDYSALSSFLDNYDHEKYKFYEKIENIKKIKLSHTWKARVNHIIKSMS